MRRSMWRWQRLRGRGADEFNGGGVDKVMSAVLSGNVDIGFAGPEAGTMYTTRVKRTTPRCLRR